MIKWQWRKSASVCLMSLVIFSAGCGHSPVRNPLAGRSEPKLGALPPVTHQASKSQAKVVWSNGTLGKQPRFSKLTPHIHGQFIYAADRDGKVIALNRVSGAQMWSINTKKKLSAGPSYAGNMLFLTTADAKVIALNAENGRQVWKAKVPSEVLAPPTAGQGVVIVHAIDGSVSAFEQNNGELRWRYDQSILPLTLRFSSSPVIVGDKALVGLASGKLVAFNLQNGLVEWERVISVPRGRSEIQRMVDITADPLVRDEMAYVITYQGKLAAVNATTGDLLWDRDISSYQNMTMDMQHLYVTDNDHVLWSIDRQTGATFWKQDLLAERYITGPAVVGNKVAVADRGGYLHFLSSAKGHLIQQREISGKFYQPPVSVGREIFTHAHNGKLAAISSQEG